jgi:primosomal protein N' (replication factor Y)
LFADAEAAGAPPGPGCSGFADVAVNRPVRCEFTYGVPDAIRARVIPGSRVAVPLGGRREVGVVVGLREDPGIPIARIKPIARLFDGEPVLDASLLELTKWIASTYACSWGEAIAAAMPGGFRSERDARTVATVRVAEGRGDVDLAALEGKDEKQHRVLRTLLELDGPIEVRELCRKLQISDSAVFTLKRKGIVVLERGAARADPLLGAVAARARPERLSADQEAALAAISPAVRGREPRTFLLQGVTGSGKTEVYLRAIETALELGRGAIVLVPEIALTPQTVGWFRSRFGDVAVLHSRMTDAQRRATWLRVQRGETRVVVGARSAVFAPLRDLGVIVVDEEHEPSFKQDGTPRYHGRDVAVERARIQGAVCLLGSATPSLETWQAARDGRCTRLLLRERVGGGRIPRIEVVDLRTEKPSGKGPVLFSRRLQQLLERAFGRREQSILFLNRRGFAPVLWCGACGETVRCGVCDVTLTFHRKIRRAVCHACCAEVAPPASCPTCTAPGLRYLGAGSERIESELARVLPGARVRRMDSDTMLRREDYESTLASFGRGEIDVLVGTQMIAKGPRFPARDRRRDRVGGQLAALARLPRGGEDLPAALAGRGPRGARGARGRDRRPDERAGASRDRAGGAARLRGLRRGGGQAPRRALVPASRAAAPRRRGGSGRDEGGGSLPRMRRAVALARRRRGRASPRPGGGSDGHGPRAAPPSPDREGGGGRRTRASSHSVARVRGRERETPRDDRRRSGLDALTRVTRARARPRVARPGHRRAPEEEPPCL